MRTANLCAPCFGLAYVDAIEQVKAQYLHFVEQHRWAEWADLFTEDAVASFAAPPGRSAPRIHRGRRALFEHVQTSLRGVSVVMRVSSPVISTEAEAGQASARWALTERLSFPAGEWAHVTNFGHYFDTYRLEPDGRWRIARTRIETVRQDVVRRDEVATGRRTTGSTDREDSRC